MLDHVGEAAIERDQNPAFARRDSEQSIVGSAHELLFTSECDIMSGLPEHRPDRVGDVLIELDRRHVYAAGIGTMVSRASSAA